MQNVIAYVGAPLKSEPNAAFMATAQLGNAEIFDSKDRSKRVAIQFDIVALCELFAYFSKPTKIYAVKPNARQYDPVHQQKITP